MNKIKSVFNDLLHLFYPHVCMGCGSDLIDEKNILCLHCIVHLPHTNFASFANNPIEKIFWGRIPLIAAHSEFYFSKESVLQHLIHQLKYKGKKEVGHYLGEMIGNNLLNSNRFNTIDYLIPLPMFNKKEQQRGYNQATIICNGISSATNIPVLNNVVVRKMLTQTQTRKSRVARWENVSTSFYIADEYKIANKHLLLVDDVVTTGASIEACAHEILKIDQTRLSIATLAYAFK